MAIITAITAQKDKNRVNLFLDGEFACGLSHLAALSAGLKVGQDVDGQRLKEIIQRSEYDSAVQKAMKYLSIKPVTAKKMTEYLLGKGFDEQIADSAVNRLKELDLINDAAYADMYVKCFRLKHGNGLIRHKLRGLGVDESIISDALTDESEAVILSAKKYLKTHKPDKQKLFAYLFNKGFNSDSARKAMHLVDEMQDADGDKDYDD